VPVKRRAEALTGNEVRPMNTVPRTPADHYREAERLLAAAESSRTAEIQSTDALIAIGHAVLATVPPRRARRRPATQPTSATGGGPRQRWLNGQDDRPDEGDQQ
jgi:hypothetical protein